MIRILLASIVALCGTGCVSNTNIVYVHKHIYQIGVTNSATIYGADLEDVAKGNKQDGDPSLSVPLSAAP